MRTREEDGTVPIRRRRSSFQMKQGIPRNADNATWSTNIGAGRGLPVGTAEWAIIAILSGTTSTTTTTTTTKRALTPLQPQPLRSTP